MSTLHSALSFLIKIIIMFRAYILSTCGMLSKICIELLVLLIQPFNFYVNCMKLFRRESCFHNRSTIITIFSVLITSAIYFHFTSCIQSVSKAFLLDVGNIYTFRFISHYRLHYDSFLEREQF